MKILQIANYSDNGGGISVQVRLLKRKLNSEGIECDILSTKGTAIQRIISVFWLLLKGKHYDLFHIHACSNKGFLPAIIGISSGRLLHKRTILTFHGGGAEPFFRKRASFVRFFLSRTNQNIVLSGFIGAVFDQFGLNYTVIPNMIEMDSNRFRSRSQLHPFFISIRSFTETYNIGCSLKAFKIVKDSFPDAKLLLVGDGPLKEAIESFANVNGISGVSFIGHVSNNQVYDYLNQADIMLSSSHFDNMPVSILEGFNAGLLVIATNVGGVPYMIEDGKNGLLFEDDNHKQMAEKMITALEYSESSLRMIENAKLSLKYYTWEVVSKRLLPLYNSNL